MEKVKEFISDITRRASSRKFIVLILACVMHWRDSIGFTGDNLVWVFAVFMGVNVVQKFVEKMK